MGTLVYKIADMRDLDAMIEAGDALFDFAVKPNLARRFIKDDRHYLMLAYCEERVVGMASAFCYIHPDKDTAMFVNEVSVVEEYRNRGIARTLVRKLVDYGKTIGCVDAWIATEESNWAARKAYRAAGGEEDAERVVLTTF